jgi:hypothetical protein
MVQEPNFDVERQSFLLEAIKDAQGVIRALDFKANALLVVMTLLLANANKVAAAAGFLARRHDCLGNVAVFASVVAIATGSCTAWFAVLTLTAQFDPRSAVDTSGFEGKGFLGSFFAGGYFAFEALPFAFGKFKPRVSAPLGTYVGRLPGSTAEIVVALAYEELKVASIRDSKAKAIRMAYALGVATLAIVAAVWLCGIMFGSDLP